MKRKCVPFVRESCHNSRFCSNERQHQSNVSNGMPAHLLYRALIQPSEITNFQRNERDEKNTNTQEIYSIHKSEPFHEGDLRTSILMLQATLTELNEMNETIINNENNLHSNEDSFEDMKLQINQLLEGLSACQNNPYHQEVHSSALSSSLTRSQTDKYDAARRKIERLRKADQDYPVEYLPGGGCLEVTPFFCHICKHQVQTEEKWEHDVSTLHMFELMKQTPPLMRNLQLSMRNRGFQLLTKMGFDELEGGLGPNRLGDIEPIKTSLKHDRLGLGFRGRSKKSSSIKASEIFYQNNLSINAIPPPPPLASTKATSAAFQGKSSIDNELLVLTKVDDDEKELENGKIISKRQKTYIYDSLEHYAQHKKQSRNDIDSDDDDDDCIFKSYHKKVTHFPPHFAHEEIEGNNEKQNKREIGLKLSRAKIMHDNLNRRKSFPKKVSKHIKSENNKRKKYEEKLKKKKEISIRNELSSSFPEGYEEYF